MQNHTKSGETFKAKEKELDIGLTNILAAKGVSDFIRTSLGPKGMDKMITTENKDVIISNDGATILDSLRLNHPVARMLIELSKSQDVEVGDGTTSVVIIAGALLEQSRILIEKGIHPTKIAENFKKCAEKVPKILKTISEKISIENDQKLIDAAITSLSSKVVSTDSALIAPIAVKAVKAISKNNINIDLKYIKIVTQVGSTISESKLVDGIVMKNKVKKSAGGPLLIKNAKIGLIQFQLSAPKTAMDFTMTVEKNDDIKRITTEEKQYVAKIVQRIAKTGCNVLMIQKSIIRDAVSTLSLDFLAKKNIMVVTDIERDDIEFLTSSLGLRPIAAIEEFVTEKLATADLVEQPQSLSNDKGLLFIKGIKTKFSQKQGAVSILLRATNDLTLQESRRSLHDALCVVRNLIKSPRIVPGGGAPEMEISVQIRSEVYEKLTGSEAMCFRAFSEAMEIIPMTLAENCGFSNPSAVVSELRDIHIGGEKRVGLNVRRGKISSLESERVVQPMEVTVRAVMLAAECVRMILKIDDVIQCVRSAE